MACELDWAKEMAQEWNRVRPQILNALESGARRSEVLGGLTQGLRDVPHILADKPERCRKSLAQALRTIVQDELPGFYSKQDEVVARVIRRGRIRTMNEWDLIRHHIDEVETDPQSHTKLKELYSLVDEYEARKR